jgi:hypothetical protein
LPGNFRPPSVPRAQHGRRQLQRSRDPEHTLGNAVANVLMALGARAVARRSRSRQRIADGEDRRDSQSVVSAAGKLSLLRAGQAAAAGGGLLPRTERPSRRRQATPSTCGCRLTPRSSGRPPARHLGREASSTIIRLAAQAPRRQPPLSSNVRPQMPASGRSASSSQNSITEPISHQA